jgi:hypothetical protein
MNARERFWGVIRRTKIDRLPVIEWAPWWKDATILRWHEEGLPRELVTDRQISAHFGLDDWRLTWMGPRSAAPKPARPDAPLIVNRADYEALAPHLWHEPTKNLEDLKTWADDHRDGDCVVWIIIEGFYWLPARLLGVENHLLAFYDQPDLIHDMNRRLAEFNLRCLDQAAAILKPDFITFAEDMSYNHGPMISKALFDEFLAPYYRRVIPRIKELGAVATVDTDGQVEPMVPWLLEAGLDGVDPLERQAGVDIGRLRARFPDLVMLGGFDKMTMPRGREAMRSEFERVLPVMASGRYFPGVDHQTPPGVSLEQYRAYLELFREYAERAVEGW